MRAIPERAALGSLEQLAGVDEFVLGLVRQPAAEFGGSAPEGD